MPRRFPAQHTSRKSLKYVSSKDTKLACIYVKSIVTADSSARKANFLLSSRPQTGIRSPPISGPRPSFLARSRRGSRSPASAGPIPARTLSGSCADALRVGPELAGSCGDASVLLVAGEDICGAVVAPRRRLGRSYSLLEKQIFVVAGACC